MKKIKQILYLEDKNHSKTKEDNQINKNVTEYLMKNVYLQNKIDFYMNLDAKVIEHLVTAPFKQNSIGHESKIFAINLLKKHTFILNIAFTHQKFDYTDLISFLQMPNVDYDLLNALQDILIPFCKKFPQKVSQFVGEPYNNKIDFYEQNLYQANIQDSLYSSFLLLTALFQRNIINMLRNHEEINQLNCFIQSFTKQETIGINVSWNLKDFLSDLTINLASVDLTLVERFLAQFNSDILRNFLTFFNNFRGIYQYEDYCEGIIIVFINILKLVETFKLSANTRSHEKDKLIKSKIQSMLCANAVDISSFLPQCIQFLSQKNDKTLNYSSGETIERVGLLKYRILELTQKLLSINQIQNLKIPFERFDFFPVITTFIERYKWNSIAHNLIVKITQHIISQDYKNFKVRYLQSIINPNKGLFGQFIINFRNRKFIFLHSMRMINQGHRSLIFRISQIIILQMQERNDLNLLVEMFKIWKQYMQIDLLDYEQKNYEISRLFDGQRGETSKKGSTRSTEINANGFESISSKPLEKFEQILFSFKEQEKWSPKQKAIRIKKQSLMEHEQIKKMDSMAQYLPPTS